MPMQLCGLVLCGGLPDLGGKLFNQTPPFLRTTADVWQGGLHVLGRACGWTSVQYVRAIDQEVQLNVLSI